MSAGTIVSLRAENVKRLKAVELKPDANGAFVIGGNNAQGKSSILDSLEWALGGASGISAMPVRKGEENARVVIELDDLTVTRKFAADGKSQLTVEAKDGAKYSSGQKMLDKLVGDLSFDPLGFTRMKPADQAKTLRDLVGLDTTALDESRADQYEYRRDINRQAKDLDGQLKGMPFYPNAPEVEVSVTALMGELKEIQAHNQTVQAASTRIQKAQEAITLTEQYVAQTAATVESLTKQLAEAKERHEAALQRLRDDAANYVKVKADAEALQAKPTTETETAIQNADDVNAQVRANRDRKAVLEKLEALEAKSAAATAKIEAIDKQRQNLVMNAAYPIEGLAFSEDGKVLFGGLPFENCSSAEQLRVSIAIGMALNPKLKVLLIRDGSLMDDKTLAMVAEMATVKGFQLWIEKVGEGEECSVIIEDGMVKPKRKRKSLTEEILEAASN